MTIGANFYFNFFFCRADDVRFATGAGNSGALEISWVDVGFHNE